MYTMLSDVQITRRQRMTFIFDEQDHLLWSGKTFSDALQWLVEIEQIEVRIVDNDRRFMISIAPLRE